MKESCSSIAVLLERYFDGESSEQETIRVEEHLKECQGCQESVRWMQRIRGAVKEPVDKVAEKEDFQWMWQNIQREIRVREKPSWWESVRAWLDISPLFRKKVWIPALATVAILVFVMVPFLLKKTPSPSVLSVVQYIDSPSYNVMVYESEKLNLTVIWLFESQEEESSPS
jgi:anti-sigma factor RsiW